MKGGRSSDTSHRKFIIHFAIKNGALSYWNLELSRVFLAIKHDAW